ncbi:hypothetical protein [Pectobacterium fontis]|uniref:ApeA N-terminal domain-containing protein n=1 Tax=Pectobacterium fontis TaxID=2558042 RepID=A0A7V8II75_9GAMM|nr:hypothetical protein [Pectobacterium fontis]KHN51224.1 hypothetical protein OI69_11570 [Pectobacterium fontis]
MSTYLNRKTIDSILNSKLELHCLSVRIWQNIPDGLELSGHGVIRQNKYGTLYLEFICTKSQYTIKNGFLQKYPSDSLNPLEKLFAEFISLEGMKFTAEGFSIELNIFDCNSTHILYTKLPFITFVENRLSDSRDDYLYYEFAESLHIPANISNRKTSSSTESESYSWNETFIELNEFKVRINNEEKFRMVRVTGNFDPDDLYDCINFYVGFSGGVFPQPYVVIKNKDDKIVSTIKSINNQNTHKRSSNPIPEQVINDMGKKYEVEHSYELFKKIHEVHQKKRDYFNSIYSQWVQVWYGFQTKNSITELVLSVAIEGILNDIYIPAFKKNRIDNKLISDIEKIKSFIKEINVSENHKQRLISSVSYWKNITVSKALDVLITEGVIDVGDKKSGLTYVMMQRILR